MFSRRRWLQSVAAGLAMPASLLQARGHPLFNNHFQVPMLDQGRRSGQDLYFELSIQSGRASILPAVETPTLGVNQPFLGATLKVKQGDRVHIRVKNQLVKTTTLHWHGMKLPAKADGGPHQPIAPGSQWETRFDIDQPAATLWYHSHQLHKTGVQVYHGLAGMFLIEDEPSRKLGLPSTYGVDDFPVILQDKDFNADGTLQYVTTVRDRMMGKRGKHTLVNGVMRPLLKVERPLIRLRLLNGSNARIYQLEFDDGRPFHLIGSDGGLLEHPVTLHAITLAPAERAEVLVDLSDGAMPILRHRTHKQPFPERGMAMMNRMMGEPMQFDIMQIDATAAVSTPVQIPHRLVSHPLVDLHSVVKQRTFKLGMNRSLDGLTTPDQFTINNKSMDMARIDEVVQAGSVEIWTIKNSTMMPHPFHIHNVQFKVLRRERKPQEHELGFKDTVLVHPFERVQLLIQFPLHRDPETPYMYHCHILEHEDHGMMGQFVVV